VGVGVGGSAAVRVVEVAKSFGGGRRRIDVLDRVSLTVPEGQFVSVIGPSGCGKSTLLRIIGGLEPATSGTVELAGADGPPRVAFVFQEHGLFPWLTALDNIAFGPRMAGMPKRERLERASVWLERLGLRGFGDRYPHQLSGGMRQRLSLARAFVTDPDILLMDEPMGALDAQTRTLIQEELLRLWEQTRKTVLLVTHSIEEALLLGDRVLVLTRRPAGLKADLPVELDRPRGIATTALPAFAELKLALWDALRDEAAAAESPAGTVR
jgi:NitT/TauT family transport system ATP-binding protein